MAKKIPLFTIKATTRLAPGTPEQDFTLKSTEFLLVALQGYPENVKTLERMLRVAGLIESLKRADAKPEWKISDADYALVKESVDKFTSWGPLILHFPQFLDSIANPHQDTGPNNPSPEKT